MPKPLPAAVSDPVPPEATRSRVEQNVLTALRVSLHVQPTETAPAPPLDFAAADGYRYWSLEATGDTCAPPDIRKRGRPPVTGLSPGSSATRLLALLEQPRHGSELPALLGVTAKRIYQLVITLSAYGLIRSADPRFPVFVLARKDDPSILLRPDQERVLSAFPSGQATTLAKIALLTHMSRGKTTTVADALCQAGLIEKTQATTFGDLYRLTAMGSAHWQRSATAPRADIASQPLPFRSDRVRDVLSHLASHGPTRTRDIGLGLAIPQTSINALMQYLKRKNVVRTQSSARIAPYELTQDGRDMLAAMRRQAGNVAAA